MADDQNQLPLGADDNIQPSAQDANSNNPPPDGGWGGRRWAWGPGAPIGPGALLMLPINIEEDAAVVSRLFDAVDVVRGARDIPGLNVLALAQNVRGDAAAA